MDTASQRENYPPDSGGAAAGSLGSSSTWLQQPWLVALLLSAVTFALFSPAIGYSFLNYDDNQYVFENAQVARGFTWDGFRYACHTIDGASWMPVTWLSYFLDTTLFGTGPTGYHFTNVLLHAINSGLLFLILQRLTRRIWPAVLVTLLFALHPQRLESVAWVAERKDVLSVFFWMLGLRAYLHHAAKPSLRRMLAVAACLLLGLMSKPMVVSFPLALLLLDFWLQRFGNSATEFRARAWPLIREKIPLLAVCASVAGLTLWSQGQGAIVPVHFAWYLKLSRVIENIGFYGQTFFVPTGLAIVHRIEPLNFLHVTLTGLVLVTISLVALRQAWRWPWLAVGWFWFLITLAPVAGLIRIGDITVADRYSYLPCVGLALAMVFGAWEIAARWPQLRFAVLGGVSGWLVCCALATWADLPRWQNTYTIFESAYRNGAHFIACDQLGSLLYARQDYQDSLAACNRGLAQNPEFASLYNTRGGDYYMLGDLDRALADYDSAIKVNPGFSATYYGRALIHVRRKQFAEARADVANYVQHGGQLDTSGLNIPAP